jgi:hypothetical protein
MKRIFIITTLFFLFGVATENGWAATAGYKIKCPSGYTVTVNSDAKRALCSKTMGDAINYKKGKCPPGGKLEKKKLGNSNYSCKPPIGNIYLHYGCFGAGWSKNLDATSVRKTCKKAGNEIDYKKPHF